MKNQTKNYLLISYDDLLMYALYKLQEKKGHTTFENLVKESFFLFPKRFQLPGYSNWPDSSLTEKTWLRCRYNGFMRGSKSKGFTLTQKGMQLAEKVGKKLNDRTILKDVNRMKKELKTRSGRLVDHVEKSGAFNIYLKSGNVVDVTEFEFCDLLYTTLDTDPSLRKRNLEELKYHVGVYGRKDILIFLKACEDKFHSLLDIDRTKFEGGMMKRRRK